MPCLGGRRCAGTAQPPQPALTLALPLAFPARRPLFRQCQSQLAPCPSPRQPLPAENLPSSWKAPRRPLGSEALRTAAAIWLFPNPRLSPTNLLPPPNNGFSPSSSSPAPPAPLQPPQLLSSPSSSSPAPPAPLQPTGSSRPFLPPCLPLPVHPARSPVRTQLSSTGFNRQTPALTPALPDSRALEDLLLSLPQPLPSLRCFFLRGPAQGHLSTAASPPHGGPAAPCPLRSSALPLPAWISSWLQPSPSIAVLCPRANEPPR